MNSLLVFIASCLRALSRRIFGDVSQRRLNQPRVRGSAFNSESLSPAFIEALEPRSMLSAVTVTPGAVNLTQGPYSPGQAVLLNHATPVTTVSTSHFIADTSDVGSSADRVQISASSHAGEFLTISNSTNVPGLTITGNGTASVTVQGTLAHINSLLSVTSNVQYTSPVLSAVPNNSVGAAAYSSAVFTFTDNLNNTGSASVSLSLVSANQSPVISGAPISAATNVNTAFVVPFSNLALSDTDGGGNSAPFETVTLSAAHGTLSLSQSVITALGSAYITGNNTSTVVINPNGATAGSGVILGTNNAAPYAANTINGALRSASAVTYTPSNNFAGADNIVISVNDNGISTYSTYAGAPAFLTTPVVTAMDAAESTAATIPLSVVSLSPIVVVTDAGGTYSGLPYPATASASLNGSDVSGSGTFTYTYYSGSSVGSSGSTTAPSAAGTYTVVSTFTSPSYTTSTSSPVVFNILPATPTVVATDAGGTYSGNAYPATATATIAGSDVSGNGTLSETYYVGTSVSGSGTTVAPSAAGTYTVVASFTSSNLNYSSNQSAPLTFSIQPAIPTVSVTDAGGAYNGSPYGETATSATGINSVTVAGTTTFAYFTGSTGGTGGSSIAPTAAGSYSVVATFTSSNTNYSNAVSAAVPFVISTSTPTVVASDASGPYNGSPFAASATVKVGATDVSGNGSVSFTYYNGTSVGASGSSTAPTATGTYTVVAAFTTSNSNVNSANSAPVTFTIGAATPTVVVTDASGLYSGSPFSASATVKLGATDVSGNGSLTYTYYSGSSVAASGTSVAPADAGTYTVVAAFTSSSSNFNSASSSPVTFTISAATPTVVASDSSGSFTGSPFSASATVRLGTTDESGKGQLSYTYYSGSSVGASGSSTAPTDVGKYTVVATFTSTNSDVTSATSAPVTFDISAATPTVTAIDAGGIYSGTGTTFPASTFAATATATVGSVSAVGSFTFTYYQGSSVSGSGSTTAPTTLGTYTVVGAFTSSSPNFNNAQSNPTTFAITAPPFVLILSTALPSTVTAGAFTGPMTVKVEDRYGNVVVSDNATSVSMKVNGVTVSTLTDSSGVVTFSSVQLTKAAVNPLTFTCTPTLIAATPALVVVPGPPDHLAFTSPPTATVVAGNTLATVKVAIEDFYNNIITTDANPISFNVNTLTGGPTGGASVLASGPTVTSSGGVTTYSNMVFDYTGTYSFSVGDSGDAAVQHLTSSILTVVAAPATSMTLVQGLSTSTIVAGVPVGPAVQFSFHDRFGNLATNDTSIVAISLTTGGTYYNGTSTMPVLVSGGFATFSNLLFYRAGTYTLKALDAEGTLLNGSGTVNLGTLQVVPAPANKLVVVSSFPSSLVAGSDSGPFTVQVQDKYGNLITNDSSTAVSMYVNNVLVATGTDVSGVVSFGSVVLTKAQSNPVSFYSVPSFAPAIPAMVVVPAPPDHVAFVSQPTATVIAGVTLATVRVAIEDVYNNIVTKDTNPISFSVNTLSGGPPGGASVLANTPVVAFVNGVTTFDNLVFDYTGTYSFTVGDSGDFGATTLTSNVVTVKAAPATNMIVVQGLTPAATVAGTYVSPAVQLALYDQFGNLATNDGSVETITITNGGTFSNGATTTTLRPTAGIATFNKLLFTQAGSYALTVTDTDTTLLNGTGTIDLGTLQVVPAPAYKLAVVSSYPATVTAGGNSGPFTVQVQDQYGNLINNNSSTVVTMYVNGVAGASVTDNGGIATFSGVQLTKAGASPITFRSSPVLGIATPAMVVNPAAPNHLAFTPQPPATVVAGSTLPPVTVAVQDIYNNVVTSDTTGVSLSVNTLTGGPAGGASVLTSGPTITTVGGVTTFSNMVINATGTYTFTVNDSVDFPGTSVTSSVVKVVPAPTTNMVVIQGLPTTPVVTGSTVSPAVQIALYDQFGNLATSDPSVVTLTVTSGGNFSTGIKTLTVRPVGGIATFSMAFNQAGTYALTATDTETTLLNGTGTANLGTLQVVPAAANKLAIVSTSPTTVAAGGNSGPFTVQVQDRLGNVITSDSSTVVTMYVNGVATAAVTDTGGIATFSGVQLTKTGSATFTFLSSPALTTVTRAISVTPGAPDHMAFITQPAASVVAGSTMPVMRVAVEDIYNNVVTSDTTVMGLSVNTLSGGPGVFAGSPTITSVGGITTFSNLVINSVGTYTFTVNDSVDFPGTTVTSGYVKVNPAPAASMVLVQGLPTTPVVAGTAVSPAVQFNLYDQFGNLATNDGSYVTVAVTNGGTFSSGATSLSFRVSNGIAMTSMVFNQAGTYALTATSTEAAQLNGSGTINLGTLQVTPAAASRLMVVSSYPSTLTAGGNSGPFTVQVQDRFGNLLTGDSSTAVKMTVNGVAGAVVTDVGGVATFSGVQLTKAGTNPIVFSSTGTITTATPAIVVTPGAPDHLGFTTQPAASVVAGSTLPAVKVAVEDFYNNVVTSDTTSISLSTNTVTGGPSGGASVLVSGPTITSAGGVTTFSNMVVNAAGTYTFTANDSVDFPGASVTSTVFKVLPAPATSMALLQGLPTTPVVAGTALNPAVQFGLYDQFGNLATNDGSYVTITITNGGTFSSGASALTFRVSNGIATFTNMVINQAGTFAMTAVSTEAAQLNGSGTVNLGTLQVAPAAASKLVFSPALPTNMTPGSSTGSITVLVEDRFGNTILGDSTDSITLKVNNVTVGTATVVNGVATFSSQVLTLLGNNTITATCTTKSLTTASATVSVA